MGFLQDQTWRDGDKWFVLPDGWEWIDRWFLRSIVDLDILITTDQDNNSVSWSVNIQSGVQSEEISVKSAIEAFQIASEEVQKYVEKVNKSATKSA